MPESPKLESYRPYLLEVRGVLSISDFHVGSGARLSISTDAPVLRDAENRPYVPASSLRGVLRAHLQREAPLLVAAADALIDSLFGETPKSGETTESGEIKKSRAGRLRVCDASFGQNDNPYAEIRDHVRIDSKYGAAVSGAKFDREVASGADLAFRLVYEGESKNDRELILLEEAIRALQSKELSCGAKCSLGYGRISLKDVQYADFDRRQPDRLGAWLSSRLGQSLEWNPEFKWPTRPEFKPDKIPPALGPFCTLNLKLTLHFEGPVLVRAPIPPAGIASKVFDAKRRDDDAGKGLITADRAFVQTGSDAHYYLPAASLRGVLKHQAKRISNRMLGNNNQAVGQLFGQVDPQSARKGLIEVSSGKLVDPPNPVYLDHVAIDRITGFAADSRKFATCGLQSPSFETSIRLRFQPKDMHLVALAGFVLRDLFDGMLWCGGGTARGYGYIRKVTECTTVLDWAGSDMPQDFMPHAKEVQRGRTKVSVTGRIPFDSWLWREAETAWRKMLPAAPVGESK